MKKVVSVVLAVMMLASLSVFAFADDVVNPSVTTKAAPEVVEAKVEGAKEGAQIEIELTSAAAELPEDATEEEKAEVEEKKDAINTAIEKVSTAEALAAVVGEVSADAKPAVSDVFYFDAKDENGMSVMASEVKEGVTPAVKVQLKVELPKNLLKVMQLVGDTWVEVPVVTDENGDTVLEISYAGPIVFVYDANVEVG